MPAIQNEWSRGRIAAACLAIITWFSIILQFYLKEGNAANFFSFFTILCNLLIAVSLTCSAFLPASRAGLFFSNVSVQSAIALYIFIVCVVYNLVLRGIVPLSGSRLFVDNMLHVVNPILYLLYWAFFRSRRSLTWKDGLQWIIFPLIYLVYSLVRGSIVHWYPYPFLNAEKLGYSRVLLNISVMLAVFLVAGMILIFLTRKTDNQLSKT